jgi:hypothetical protein
VGSGACEKDFCPRLTDKLDSDTGDVDLIDLAYITSIYRKVTSHLLQIQNKKLPHVAIAVTSSTTCVGHYASLNAHIRSS